jgi:hypothetical protein
VTEQCVTTSRLASDMLAIANKIDRAGDDALAESETLAALRHLIESLEAAERTAARL